MNCRIRVGNIGHKNLVFSTVGVERAFERLPRAPRLSPEELVARADDYGRTTGYPVQVQWTLIDGVNDTPEEVEGITRLLAGRYAVLNLIPYNSVPELPYRRPAWDKAAAMARTLHQRGILTKLRHSAGQDVEGGCGQLRARQLPPSRVIPIAPQ